MKDSFFKNSLILVCSNLLTGVLSFIFSIILSRELGAEGMGLYGLIMPIYDLFICLICGGMVTAISKVGAEFFGTKDINNLHKTIDVALLFDIIWAIIIVLFVFINAPFISSHIIRDTRTAHSLQVACPAMLFIALSSILKGYFYGISHVKIPAIIDILEKGFRIIIILTIFKLFILSDLNSTVTAAYITLAIGEFISLLMLYVFYINNKQIYNVSSFKKQDSSQLMFNVLIISLPLCLNGFLTTAISSISTLMLPRRLIFAGFEYSASLAMIGKFDGMSLHIVFFPMLVIHSMVTVLIPDLSEKLSKKKYWIVEKRVSKILTIAFLLGLSTTIICLTISDSLGMMFFKRDDLGNYIKFASLCCPITFASMTTFGILNGLGRQNIILRNSLLVSLQQLIILYFLTAIPSINIFGYGISLIITSITMLAANLHEIKKHLVINLSSATISIYLLLSLLIYFILGTINNLLLIKAIFIKNIIIITLGFLLMFLLSSFISNEKCHKAS